MVKFLVRVLVAALACQVLLLAAFASEDVQDYCCCVEPPPVAELQDVAPLPMQITPNVNYHPRPPEGAPLPPNLDSAPAIWDSARIPRLQEGPQVQPIREIQAETDIPFIPPPYTGRYSSPLAIVGVVALLGAALLLPRKKKLAPR